MPAPWKMPALWARDKCLSRSREIKNFHGLHKRLKTSDRAFPSRLGSPCTREFSFLLSSRANDRTSEVIGFPGKAHGRSSNVTLEGVRLFSLSALESLVSTITKILRSVRRVGTVASCSRWKKTERRSEQSFLARPVHLDLRLFRNAAPMLQSVH